MAELFAIAFGAIFVNNFVLTRFLGICAFLGVSKSQDTAMGMGLAVIFVMTVAGATTYIIDTYILQVLGIGYMFNIMFIMTIAAIVQVIEMVIKKVSPQLYEALGVFLPLITTNCAILGVTVLNLQLEYTFIQAVVHAFAAGAGFLIAIVTFAGIRERIEHSDIWWPFKGLPIALMVAAFMSTAFGAFQGIVG